MEIIREQALALPRRRLIIIDPISAYLDGADSHNNASVRALLAPLSELAHTTGAAVILVTHLNKVQEARRCIGQRVASRSWLRCALLSL
jgi:RecA-family ATPase